MLDTEQVLCVRHDWTYRRHRAVSHRHCPLTPDADNRVSNARWGCRELMMPKLEGQGRGASRRKGALSHSPESRVGLGAWSKGGRGEKA